MSMKYETPEFEVIRFRKNQSVFTSGPVDLHDGEEFDPDAGNSGAKAGNYFADD